MELSQASAYINDAINQLRNHPIFNKYFLVCGISVSLLISRILFKKWIGHINKSPPQLYGLPFIGSLFTMIIYQNSFRDKILPKYGDLVTYNIANIKYYKINEIGLAKKILNIAKDRPYVIDTVFQKANVEPGLGSINNDRDWMYRRKKLMKSLTQVLNSSKLNDKLSKEYINSVSDLLGNLMMAWIASKLPDIINKPLGLYNKEKLFQFGAYKLHELVENDYDDAYKSYTKNSRKHNKTAQMMMILMFVFQAHGNLRKRFLFQKRFC